MFALEKSDKNMKFQFDKKTNIVKITYDKKVIGLCNIEESETLLMSLIKLKKSASNIVQFPSLELN